MTERPSAHAVEFVDVASMAKWIQKDGVGSIIAGMVDFLEETSRSGRVSTRFRASPPPLRCD